MGKNTITWADDTWNPWRGCTKVSAGCANCYMFREQRRYGRDPAVVTRAKPATFNVPLRWQRDIDAGKVKGPRLVFTCSWSDWFHQDADGWRDDAWDIISRTPDLVYQILTKRPERIKCRLPSDWGDGYPNVWLGVSVENQEKVYRITELGKIPAKLRFISAEPLLGYVDIRGTGIPSRIGWVIAGGESGGRPMKLAWAVYLRDQCVNLRIPYFLKQLGGPVHDKKDGVEAVLDGVMWTQMPIVGVQLP